MQEPVISQDEISDFRWVSFPEARTLLHGSCGDILRQALERL
jgi:hypothetical protein